MWLRCVAPLLEPVFDHAASGGFQVSESSCGHFDDGLKSNKLLVEATDRYACVIAPLGFGFPDCSLGDFLAAAWRSRRPVPCPAVDSARWRAARRAGPPRPRRRWG